MEKLLVYALALAVSLGTTALLANNGRPARPTETTDAQRAADGAFRDGLYVGGLTAAGGRPLRPPIGRWSNDDDRASFVAGYRRGYGDFLAGVAGGNEVK